MVNLRGTAEEKGTAGAPQHDYEYDLIVIGGGSGGMAAAKEAANLGAKVALFDYVKPSPQGSTWGLGGTCVNVGCVPKKVCHYAALLGLGLHDAKELGWEFGPAKHNWETLMDKIYMQRGQLNFSYRNGLRSAKVNYINALASFESDHVIRYIEKGVEKRTSALYIVIAVGGRPVVPADIPGAVEHAITSDDIFMLPKAPGRTLCVGGSYIALECAGFLQEMGYPTSVAVRSILLRGFDRQCTEKIAQIMKELGTKFLYGVLPTRITKRDDGTLEVLLRDAEGKEFTEVYDTVLFATGRAPDTKGLHLEAAGVAVNSKGKFDVDEEERTNVPHIYAVGDVLEGKYELTPVAIKAGELLVRRLFAGSKKRMDFNFVPTTVFTPTEYGSVGLSEEKAIADYGPHDVEVYLSEWMTLEYAAAHRVKHPSAVNPDDMVDDLSPMCLGKLICVKSQSNKVVGFHYVGPNAGEVTQGFTLALRLGATKQDFDDLVGIHPTDAEAFTMMTVTKSSGKSWLNVGCGGGKCG